jgi:hypothetical protein
MAWVVCVCVCVCVWVCVQIYVHIQYYTLFNPTFTNKVRVISSLEMNSSTYYWYKYGFVVLWCCWCVMSGLSLSHHDESDNRTRDTVNNSRRKLQSLEQPPSAPQQESYSKSVGFYLMDWDFTCESVPCDASTNSNLETLQQAYVHMVIGTDHPTSFGLLVYRMCEVFQKCIRPQNVKLILQHQLLEDSSVSYANCSNFLRQIDVEFYDWWGKFTVDNKMRQSYRLLDTKNIQDDKRIIYQTDIDEVPDPKLFALALKELASGSCDAIRGMWRDRIAVDGSLAPVNIDSKMSLEQQFPLRCDISNNVVGAGMTRKVIAYRSNYRVSILNRRFQSISSNLTWLMCRLMVANMIFGVIVRAT